MDIVEDIMENIGNIATTVFSPDGKKSVGQTKVISEHVLTVIINSHPVYRLVCTRCNLRELVAGRLLTDGFIEKAEDIAKISFSDDEDEADEYTGHDEVTPKKYAIEMSDGTVKEFAVSLNDKNRRRDVLQRLLS